MTMEAVTPQSYPVNLSLPLDQGGRLIVFVSYPTKDVLYREIAGREVFLFDFLDRPVWQIAPERGTTEARTHPFDRSIETDEPFVNVSTVDSRYYTSRINGDTFLIDMATGVALYSGWART